MLTFGFLGIAPAAAIANGEAAVDGQFWHYPAPDTSACAYDSGAPYFRTPTGGAPVLVSVEQDGPNCPHSQQETTARVDAVAGWVDSVVTDLP